MLIVSSKLKKYAIPSFSQLLAILPKNCSSASIVEMSLNPTSKLTSTPASKTCVVTTKISSFEFIKSIIFFFSILLVSPVNK